jgi:hypothetical protein
MMCRYLELLAPSVFSLAPFENKAKPNSCPLSIVPDS